MTGNSQDLSVLSNIDLRISGNLSDNLKIQAVISDNNLPFQEDGSSYKLQEFDNLQRIKRMTNPGVAFNTAMKVKSVIPFIE